MAPFPLPIDPEFALIVDDILAAEEEFWKLSLAEMRAAEASEPPRVRPELPSLSEIDVRHELIPVSDNGEVELQIYSPKGVTGVLPMCLLFHGGGFVFGNHGVEEGCARAICVFNKCRVISVDYRLAPEFKYPYAFNDCWDALKWCQSNADRLEIDPTRIILCGGSAGANLAACVALRVRDEGMPGIIGQILNLPGTCHPNFFPKDKYPNTSFEENKDAPILNLKNMKWVMDLYNPNPVPDPYHSPLLAESHAGLAPALVQVAGMDPLRDEGLAYAEALKQAGVDVQVKLHEGVPHGFKAFPQLSKVAEYENAMVDWVRARLG